mgnify:CR=1 FL=1
MRRKIKDDINQDTNVKDILTRVEFISDLYNYFEFIDYEDSNNILNNGIYTKTLRDGVPTTSTVIQGIVDNITSINEKIQDAVDKNKIKKSHPIIKWYYKYTDFINKKYCPFFNEDINCKINFKSLEDRINELDEILEIKIDQYEKDQVKLLNKDDDNLIFFNNQDNNNLDIVIYRNNYVDSVNFIHDINNIYNPNNFQHSYNLGEWIDHHNIKNDNQTMITTYQDDTRKLVINKLFGEYLDDKIQNIINPKLLKREFSSPSPSSANWECEGVYLFNHKLISKEDAIQYFKKLYRESEFKWDELVPDQEDEES